MTALIYPKNLALEVVSTKRKKSASIIIKKDLVQIVVPESLSKSRVDELIKKRMPWIKKKLLEQSKKSILVPKEFVNGESFSYLGKNYRLKIISDKEPGVKITDGKIYVSGAKEKKTKIKSLLINWYKKCALEKLQEKTNRYSKIINVFPNSVSIKTYKARWGTCSLRGDITYNWKLIMAPHKIIDYVVIHELCHLLEHNHSTRYWQNVKSICPDHKDRKEWLRLHADELNL